MSDYDKVRRALELHEQHDALDRIEAERAALLALLARVFADDYTALRQVCRWAAEAGLDGVRLVICVKDENDNYVNLTRAELLAALGEQIVEER